MLWLNNLVYKIQIWKWAVKNESEVAQACPTLCDSMDYSPPGSSGHAILQAIVLEWVAISFSRRSSQPKDRTRVSRIAGRCFTIWAVKGKCPSTSACSKKKKAWNLRANRRKAYEKHTCGCTMGCFYARDDANSGGPGLSQREDALIHSCRIWTLAGDVGSV